jgi:hypothetical protein
MITGRVGKREVGAVVVVVLQVKKLYLNSIPVMMRTSRKGKS